MKRAGIGRRHGSALGSNRIRLAAACKRGGTIAVLLIARAHVALAAPTGASMPWDTPLTTILDNLQGTVARVLVTVAVVLTGLLFAFGEAGGAFKKVFGIAFGGALALGALTFMSALGFVGATF
jgi:type IV secretion system protein VirB2